MCEFPELDKMLEVQEQSQAIGEFLEWLQSQGIILSRFDDESDALVGTHRSIERLLADYFEIDLDAVERERRVMLERIRSGS